MTPKPTKLAAERRWTVRALRPARAVEGHWDDRAFIVPTWSDSWHDESREVRDLPFRVYRERMFRRLDRILDRVGVEGFAAVLPDDETHVLGYIVGEGPILHYVFVREGRRGYGIARELVATWALTHPCVEASHDTKHGARIRRALNVTYNPLAVEGRA